MKPFTTTTIVILSVLATDQVSKFWIKTNMYLGQEYRILGDWFIIHFTENYGMAFGLEFAGEFGKLFLTLFRILAALGIGYYVWRLTKEKASPGLILSFSLIFAGAIGNIIDSAFYGLLFSDSYNQVASFLPEEGGYGRLLHGKVVDMLYFPLVEGYLPDWLPVWGGEYFIFFRPVFNIADSSITIGVAMIILFQKKFFPKKAEPSTSQETGELA